MDRVGSVAAIEQAGGSVADQQIVPRLPEQLAAAAQDVVNASVAAGIRALLNFSPGNLKVPPGVKLKNVDLTVSLESLSFFLARGESDEGEE